MSVNRFEFGSLMFSFTYEFSKLERKMSAKSGLYSGQPRVLTILKLNEGSTLSELSELSGIGMPSLSVSVRNMEKSGLLRREISGTDGRVQKIFLTESGFEKAAKFHEEIDLFYDKLLKKLGEQQSQSMADCLTAMKDEFELYNKGEFFSK